MWGSEFFIETLIILLLLFDAREQLLIKKKLFYFSKSHMLQKCHITIYFQIRDKFLGYSGSIFAFLSYQQPKRKYLKNENQFTYVCQ